MKNYYILVVHNYNKYMKNSLKIYFLFNLLKNNNKMNKNTNKKDRVRLYQNLYVHQLASQPWHCNYVNQSKYL